MKNGVGKNIFRYKVVFSAFFFISCATTADYNFSAIDTSIGRSDYPAVYAELEKDNKKLYSKNDVVLSDIDKGLISHYAGEAERSNKELSDAEQKIREYASKSVTQSVGSYIVNDNVKDYSGETYEDIYTNVFKCLNYLELGNHDEAFVEIRRFDNKLKDITQQYQGLLASAQKDIDSKGGKMPAADMKFHNSALARYMSMLMYRSEGNTDDARIDYKQIKTAFALQRELYDFDIPASINDDIDIPKGMARLNVISFTGLAPVKVENTLRVAMGNTYYKLALPEMKKRGSNIASADITAVSKTDGSRNTVQLEKIESIENIAVDTYQQHYALIFARSLTRSIAKATTTAVLNDQSQNDNGTTGGVLGLLSLATALTTEFTERADVRTTRYFPATASVTGMTLTPGVYDITVKYYDGRGSVAAERQFPAVTVSPQVLNLVESICLR